MKKELIETTTLLFDFKAVDIPKIEQQVQIWIYSLPDSRSRPVYEQRNQNLIWARERTEKPYYLYQPPKDDAKLYIVYASNESVPDIYDETYLLPKKKMVGFDNNKVFHCIIKVLLAKYMHQEAKFVSNDHFYLFAKRYKYEKGTYNYANVLKIAPTLSSQKDKDNNKTERYELLLHDTGTRLREQSFDLRNKKQIPYEFTELPNDQLIFKQLKVSQLPEDSTMLIYEENTDNEYRTKIVYHAIKNVKQYEETRNTLLQNYVKAIQCFFQQLGFDVLHKNLSLEEQSDKVHSSLIYKKERVDVPDFEIYVFDKRFEKKNDFQLVIKKLNDSKKGIKFIASSETLAPSKNSNVFILMDYSKADFEQTYLKDKFQEDGYKVVKNAGFITSQGFCMNPNSFEEVKKETYEDFMDYKAMLTNHSEETKVPKKPKKDTPIKVWVAGIERNLDICVQQLFLKSLILQDQKIENRLPNVELVQKLLFIHCFTENKRYAKLSFIENDKFNIEDLYNEKSTKKLIEYGINDIDDLIDLWETQNPYGDFGKNDLYLMVSKDFIWEIQSVKERVLYPDVKSVLERREAKLDKNIFKLAPNHPSFSANQVEAYNEFIDDITDDKLSFEILMSKSRKHRAKIFECLEILKETKFADALGFKGKKAGNYLKTAKGIWFDEDYLQYFVGSKNGYHDYTQQKGFQVRKIVVLKGVFEPTQFFPLLNVDFIRYHSYTVVPYIYRMIKMYVEIESELNKVKKVQIH